MQKIRRKTFIPLLVSAALCVAACTDESLVTAVEGSHGRKTAAPIPYFADASSLHQAIDFRTSLHNNGVATLYAYEQANGYTSLGTYVDMTYFSVVEDSSYTSYNQFVANVMIHSDCMGIYHEDSILVCLPKYLDMPQRYIANEDGLFQVGNLYGRLFESGIVYTDASNLPGLRTLTEASLDNLNTSYFTYIPTEERETETELSSSELIQTGQGVLQNMESTPHAYFTGANSLLGANATIYMGIDDSPIPHTNHEKKVSHDPCIGNLGSNRVSMKFSYTTNLYEYGKDRIAKIQIKSYKRYWYTFGIYVLKTAELSANIKLASCVDNEVYVTSVSISEETACYEREIYYTFIPGLFIFTPTKKYVHFRGCNSFVQSDNVPLGAWCVFGDQSYF